MFPNKYEKQSQDYCDINNDKSLFIPHCIMKIHADMFCTCQFTCKKRFKSCDRSHNTPVIKKMKDILSNLKKSCRSYGLTSVALFTQVNGLML